MSSGSAVAGGLLRADLVGADVLAEADHRVGVSGGRRSGASGSGRVPYRPAAEPTTDSDGTVVRPAASSTGTSVSPRRSTAAPAARTRSRFGLRSPKTTRSTEVRRACRRSSIDAPVTRRRPRTETSDAVGTGPGTTEAPARRSRSPAVASSWPLADEQRPAPGEDADVAVDQREHGPGRHDARPVGARDERHPVVRAGRGDDRAARGSRSAASSPIAATIPSYQPTAATPARTSDAARQGVARPARHPAVAASDDRSTLRLGGRSSAGRPTPRARPGRHRRPARPSRSPRRRARRGAARVARPAAAPARRTSAARRDTACAAGAAAGIDGGRTSAGSSARTSPTQRQQVALDRRQRVLAARDEPLAHRHAARPDARHAVDLALAPAALAGRAHQAARPVEPEAARQDRAGRRRAGATASGSPSIPSNSRPSNVKRDRRARRGAPGPSTRRHLSGCGRSASCRCRRASTRGRRRGLPSRARARCRSA